MRKTKRESERRKRRRKRSVERRRRRRKRRKRKKKKRERGPARGRNAKEAVHVAEIPVKHQTGEVVGLMSTRGLGVGRGREAGRLEKRGCLISALGEGTNPGSAGFTLTD